MSNKIKDKKIERQKFFLNENGTIIHMMLNMKMNIVVSLKTINYNVQVIVNYLPANEIEIFNRTKIIAEIVLQVIR